MDRHPLELAECALGHVDGEGQVTVTHERSLLSRFARSAPTQATEVDDLTVEVVVVRDGHVGSASTNRTDDDALRTAAARATAAATALASSGPGGYPGLPAPEAPRRHDGFDAATAALDPAWAGGALAKAFAVTAEAGLEAFGVWTAGAVRTAIASSTGQRVSDATTDAFMKVMARDGSADPARSGLATQAAVAAGELDAAALAAQAVTKVGRGALAELDPGSYPVVLAPDAVGVLLEFLGALAFDGLAHTEGRGALSGRLGTRVTSPAINLADAPRAAGTYPRAFDAEGVPKRPLPLIQDGVAHRVCHDTRSAALAGAGARSTGHALQVGGGDGAFPTNLVLLGGGAADEAELCAPIERGIYVTRLWYVNVVHPTQTLLTGMTRDGTFLVEDGRITRPLRDVRFTDSVLRLLEHTEALTMGSRLVTEAEYYGRRFATGAVTPALRAGGFRITGATT